MKRKNEYLRIDFLHFDTRNSMKLPQFIFLTLI